MNSWGKNLWKWGGPTWCVLAVNKEVGGAPTRAAIILFPHPLSGVKVERPEKQSEEGEASSPRAACMSQARRDRPVRSRFLPCVHREVV